MLCVNIHSVIYIYIYMNTFLLICVCIYIYIHTFLLTYMQTYNRCLVIYIMVHTYLLLKTQCHKQNSSLYCKHNQVIPPKKEKKKKGKKEAKFQSNKQWLTIVIVVDKWNQENRKIFKQFFLFTTDDIEENIQENTSTEDWFLERNYTPWEIQLTKKSVREFNSHLIPFLSCLKMELFNNVLIALSTHFYNIFLFILIQVLFKSPSLTWFLWFENQ